MDVFGCACVYYVRACDGCAFSEISDLFLNNDYFQFPVFLPLLFFSIFVIRLLSRQCLYARYDSVAR